ncbi:MAG: alpha/beta hydrolase [Clostridia bacterium]|nr:alpha/beta hydrolase [Clostridia bacterium]
MKVVKDVNYAQINHPQQMLDIYLPNCESFPVFIYFHGGGIESGDKEGTDVIAKYLTDKNIAFVTCNYRMYPYASYPEFIKDAAAAVAWVYNNISQYGNATKFIVGGSSAGGYLSMMLCFDKKYLAPFKINPDDINAYIHDAGQPTSHFNVLRERGFDSRRVIIDETAPIYHVTENPDYSKMLFIVSDDDMENRYEQTMLMMSTLKHFNGECDKFKLKVMNGTHCQYVHSADENDNNVFAKICAEYICNL